MAGLGRLIQLCSCLAVACAPVADHSELASRLGVDRVEPARALDPSAGPLSSLELRTTAGVDNLLYNFRAAEDRYRSNSTFEIGSEAWAENQLHLALNKSSLGETETAQAMFRAPLAVLGRNGSTIARLKSDIFYAQHLLNKGSTRRARALAQDGILRGERALERATIAPERKAKTSVTSITIDAETSARLSDVGASRNSDLQISDGALSWRDQVSILTAQSHYLRYVSASDRTTRAAGDHLKRARELLRTVAPAAALWLRAEVARTRARDLARDGDLDAALVSVSAAVRYARGYAFDQRPEALALLDQGNLLLGTGQSARGFAAYRRAISILSQGGRGVSYDKIAPFMNELAKNPAGQDNAEELFAAAQTLRNPIVSDTLELLAARLSGGENRASLAIRELQDAELQRARLAGRLDIATGSGIRDQHVTGFLKRELAAAERARDAAQRSVAEIAPNYAQVINRSVDLASFRSVIGSGDLYIQVRLGTDHVSLLAVSRDGLRHVDLDSGSKQLADLVETIRGRMNPASGTFPLASARELYAVLLGPIQDMVDRADRLIVSPDGPLLSVPIGLLIVDGTFDRNAEISDYSRIAWLGSRKPIRIAMSASSHFSLSEAARSQASLPFAGFADFEPIGSARLDQLMAARKAPERCLPSVSSVANLGRLPASGLEVQQIAEYFRGATNFLGEQYTDTAIKSTRLDQFRILHFAGHGLLPQSNECLPEPALVTSFPQAGGDALLEASEIVSLKLDADLIVLSGCDTGGGAGVAAARTGFRGRGGEALGGLVRAFFYSGARNVVASHWIVPDATTAPFMTGFYYNLSTGMRLEDALLEARRRFIEFPPTSHPFYWSAFTLIGATNETVAAEAGLARLENRATAERPQP